MKTMIKYSLLLAFLIPVFIQAQDTTKIFITDKFADDLGKTIGSELKEYFDSHPEYKLCAKPPKGEAYVIVQIRSVSLPVLTDNFSISAVSIVWLLRMPDTNRTYFGGHALKRCFSYDINSMVMSACKRVEAAARQLSRMLQSSHDK